MSDEIKVKQASCLWQELVEMDDRTSPAEYPDMALISFDEFHEFLERHRIASLAEAKEVLERLEAACDNVASCHSAELYEAILRECGCAKLITLDDVRRLARALIERLG